MLYCFCSKKTLSLLENQCEGNGIIEKFTGKSIYTIIKKRHQHMSQSFLPKSNLYDRFFYKER